MSLPGKRERDREARKKEREKEREREACCNALQCDALFQYQLIDLIVIYKFLF